jgi:hypothetical protein
VNKTIVCLAELRARARDHIFCIVKGVDMFDQRAKASGGEAVAATDLEHVHFVCQITTDVVIFQLALEDVHDIDFDVVFDAGRALVPMQVSTAFHKPPR